MHRHLVAATIAGLFLALFGLFCNLASFGPELEEDLGLRTLFRFRGPRPVPPNISIVTLDQESSDMLGLPVNPLRWPRNLHAALTESLFEKGASAIVFDILFNEPTSESTDEQLARAFRKAGNVILTEAIRREFIPVSMGPLLTGQLHVEKTVPPIEPLAESAAAVGPFPLPKVPMYVSQCWKFKTEAGCKPTMPFLVLQFSYLSVYREFFRLLESISPQSAAVLPENADKILAGKSVGKTAAAIRAIFEENPWIAEEMVTRLRRRQEVARNSETVGMLLKSVRAYTGSDSMFLNFYGPPGSFPTISFHRFVGGQDDGHDVPDVSGKIVFVGVAEYKSTNQRDAFRTVFTRSDGTDLSGVEIAATAFANLLEDMPVRPVAPGVFLLVSSIWGLILGCTCFLLPVPASGLIVAFAALIYMTGASILFKIAGIWMPIAIPMVLQTPLAFLGGFAWQHVGVKKERQQIRRAFGFFLPDGVIDQIIDEMRASRKITHAGQTVFGTVLCSDGAQYTTLSERLSPSELNTFLNRYYETLLQPVKVRGGTVSDIIGDSMLAIWAKAHPDTGMKRGACEAALDIVGSLIEFNRTSEPYHLHTRMGLHYGQLLMGNIGGADHFEYRPVGDVVNTASRLEGLNKHLGTQILASEEVVGGLDGFVTRELGRFLLYGKSNPLRIYELICGLDKIQKHQVQQSLLFSEALRAFERRLWDEAEALFLEYMLVKGEDRAARFYVSKCHIFKRNSPSDLWDGVVSFDTK
ncbi:MAG: adenylate/guanylate cyclase domain-containing protein [Syntrophobacter sp.]